jgi:spore coat polysaccharide biosynthesis protein SpsF
MDISGGTMLERVIERVLRSNVDRVVVASPHDLPCSVPLFIGDEFDVVKRYYDCSLLFNADPIIRITSDCPLIDPEIINYALDYYEKHDYPYVYFAPVDGLDVEVFSFDLLKETHENATSKEDREHVTPYMKRKTKISVDTEKDLERVRQIWNGRTK